MKSIINTRNESGAVSIFVVIFAMLIITVITVSFLRLMMVDQQQATDTDLSQSAYDSAQAGVEDAKRALLRYQRICSTTTSPTECASLSTDLQTEECNLALTYGGIAVPEGYPSKTGEVKVQQQENDEALQQAYTCVTMQLETDDYIGDLSPGESSLVPLVSSEPFNTVTIRWFSAEDVSSGSTVTLQGSAPTRQLLSQSAWGPNTPSLMRAQFMQFGGSFTMGDFDVMNTGGGATQSNANTAFLYPTSSAGATLAELTALDNRKSDPAAEPEPDEAGVLTGSTPHSVRCASNFNSSEYACSMSLRLPDPIGGAAAGRTAFLRLTPFYNASHFQVTLYNGDPTSPSNLVQFKDVQPMIDSTGRANDIFRRVQTRVDLYNTDFPYPDASIDINGNFCKNFAVSTDPSVYANSVTSCTP